MNERINESSLADYIWIADLKAANAQAMLPFIKESHIWGWFIFRILWTNIFQINVNRHSLEPDTLSLSLCCCWKLGTFQPQSCSVTDCIKALITPGLTVVYIIYWNLANKHEVLMRPLLATFSNWKKWLNCNLYKKNNDKVYGFQTYLPLGETIMKEWWR